jgi:hypothetical protein
VKILRRSSSERQLMPPARAKWMGDSGGRREARSEQLMPCGTESLRSAWYSKRSWTISGLLDWIAMCSGVAPFLIKVLPQNSQLRKKKKKKEDHKQGEDIDETAALE